MILNEMIPNDARKRHDKLVDMRIMKLMAVGGVAVLLLYAQLLTWGTSYIRGPYLHIAQMSGLAGESSLLELVELCKLRGNADCVEQALADRTRITQNPQAQADLGRFLFRMKRYDDALKSYERYYSMNGKRDSKIDFEMGRVLVMLNKNAEAVSYLRSSIETRTDILATHPTQYLVQALTKLKQPTEAYRQILEFHASAENAKGYLNTERQALEKELGKEAVAMQRKFEAGRKWAARTR